MYKLISVGLVLAFSSMSHHAVSAPADKVTICHNYGEISVAAQAVQAHLNHGDIVKEEGVACPERPATEPEPEIGDTVATVVMMRCDGESVVSLNDSVDAGELLLEGTCAQVLADLLNSGLELRSVTGGNGVDDAGFMRLYADYLLIGTAPETEAPL